MRRRRLMQYLGLSSFALFSDIGTRSTLAHSILSSHHLSSSLSELQAFNYNVSIVNQHGQEISSESRQARYFDLELETNIPLRMVAIAGGEFTMGASAREGQKSSQEEPRHRVSVQPFFMSKYLITQAQWHFVSQLPQINRALMSNPAHFSGDDRPVESVSWLDATEFCDRLSRHSNRNYRLPSEAEWEYACRAGTNTAFSSGATLTAEFANYGTEFTYAAESPSEYLPATTPVDRCAPNAFGLNDMHGNLWEWCADHWHGSYHGAPQDSQAWVAHGQDPLRALRGGSWADHPSQARSASRSAYEADALNRMIGFRVACV